MSFFPSGENSVPQFVPTAHYLVLGIFFIKFYIYYIYIEYLLYIGIFFYFFFIIIQLLVLKISGLVTVFMLFGMNCI